MTKMKHLLVKALTVVAALWGVCPTVFAETVTEGFDNFSTGYNSDWQVVLNLPEGAEIGTCQRPLRAQTLQGERVALAQSEEAPKGTTIEFSVLTLAPGLEKVLAECWEYAQLRFMGAWRNSGKGTAIIEEVK